MITEDYVSFEVAKLLKEKEFDEDCSKVYINGELRNVISKEGIKECTHCYNSWLYPGDAAAPTLQIAMKWLREIHKIQLWSEPYEHEKGQYNAYVRVKWFIHQWQGVGYKSNEEACEAAIKYCLENLI